MLGDFDKKKEVIKSDFELLDSLNIPIMNLNSLLILLDELRLGKKKQVQKLDVEILYFLRKSYLKSLQHQENYYAFIKSCNQNELYELFTQVDGFLVMKRNEYHEKWIQFEKNKDLDNRFELMSCYSKQFGKLVEKMDQLKHLIQVEIIDRETARQLQEFVPSTIIS